MVRSALLAGCAAVGVMVAGCGTPPPGTARTTATVPSPPSPQQRAAADAASLLTAFRPPPGAARSGRLTVSWLTQAPDAPMSPDLVTRTEWYRVPGRWQTVYTWLLTHPPAGLTLAGRGAMTTGPVGNSMTTQNVEYSRPPVPGVLTQRWLEISVAGDGAGLAAVRVDAVDVWLPAKPAGERIPVAAKVVTITPVRGAGPATAARPVTITSPATVARIAAVIDGLPVFPPGVMSCPMFQGRGMRLTFHAAAGGPALAVIQGDTTGCGTVSVTIDGRPMPGLGGATTMQQQVLAIAGLHWPGFPA